MSDRTLLIFDDPETYTLRLSDQPRILPTGEALAGHYGLPVPAGIPKDEFDERMRVSGKKCISGFRHLMEQGGTGEFFAVFIDGDYCGSNVMTSTEAWKEQCRLNPCALLVGIETKRSFQLSIPELKKDVVCYKKPGDVVIREQGTL